MNDLLIPTVSAEKDLDLLDMVLKFLSEAGFKLNFKKCSFLKQSINFLGHEVGPNGLSPGFPKVKSIEKFKQPTNTHEICQFLGLAGYFRKIIKNFAIIALPLTKLI